jgi:hypothetical protein
VSPRLSVAIKITTIRSPANTFFLFIYQRLYMQMPSVLTALTIDDEI